MKQARMFFSEEKNQKTFASWRFASRDAMLKDIKVFCFFSSEKKTFLSASLKDVYMRRLLLAFVAFVALLPAISSARAAPACQSVSPFRLGLDHLDGYRFYKGPGGDTDVAPLRIEARQVPMLKTGKSLSILDLPVAHTRGDEIVVGAPDVEIGMHPAPAKEMFIMLGGSVTVTTPKFRAELHPGSVLLFDDVGSTTGHGGHTGPCGYISLSIAP